jgi:DNA helicase-4
VGTNVSLIGTRWQSDVEFPDIQDSYVRYGSFFNSVFIKHVNGSLYKIQGLRRTDADKALSLLRRGQLMHNILLKWPDILDVHSSWHALLKHPSYIPNSLYRHWINHNCKIKFPSADELFWLETLDRPKYMLIRQLQEIIRNSRDLITIRNDEFVQREISTWRDFFDSVETHPLTGKQRLSVVHDEDNNLVVAGAGTGKTSTIIAKVGYILKKKLASPDEILLLAFTRKAAQEMQERIGTKYHENMNVRTFHSLGLEILKEVEGKKPSLCKESADPVKMRETLNKLISELLDDDEFRADYIKYQVMHRVSYRTAWEFKDLAEYKEYLVASDLRTLNGDLVKSFEECELANWLYLNGIKFQYESKYPIDTATRHFRQYHPDFFLPDYNIYIEHFAINRNGKVPWFIDQAAYISRMAWIRSIHQLNNTIIIETYSWQRTEGRLFDELNKALKKYKVKAKPIPDNEVLNRINELGHIDPFTELIATFLSLYKGNGITPKHARARADNLKDPVRANIFLNLFFKIQKKYEARNREKGDIDFDDMIIRATRHIRKGEQALPFKYILVDEFQDISAGRSKLLIALRDQQAGCKLFCVGDDWQSIYRFTGSDLSLMTKYDLLFGYTKRTDLDRTFRFNDKIENFSTRFILKNSSQLKKELIPNDRVMSPCIELRFRNHGEDSIGDILSKIQNDTNGQSSVLILERYNFFIPAPDVQDTLRKRYPKLFITYLTSHSSKGLEADYVIVDNMNRGRYGFPTEITDDPLLEIVLSEPDQYQHGEERRLFYVAVTRARKKVYLISDPIASSAFVKEIMNDSGYEIIIHGDKNGKMNTCPSCMGGQLVPRTQEASNILFYGCSNYPLCTYSETACPICFKGRLMNYNAGMLKCNICSHTGRLCPRCKKGRMVKRIGRHGTFWGCTMYTSEVNKCYYTENAEEPLMSGEGN